MTNPTSVPPDQLPATLRDFLQAYADRDADTAIRFVAADAVVTDQGRTFRGTGEVLQFLRDSGAEYTYTTELLGADRTDDRHWTVAVRIEGDFPGGTADLSYRLVLVGGQVQELHIGA